MAIQLSLSVGMGLIPGQGTKIPQIIQSKIKTETIKNKLLNYINCKASIKKKNKLQSFWTNGNWLSRQVRVIQIASQNLQRLIKQLVAELSLETEVERRIGWQAIKPPYPLCIAGQLNSSWQKLVWAGKEGWSLNRKDFTCSVPSGFSWHWDLRILAAVLPSRQQNGKKKNTSLGNLISSKKWGRNASRGSSIRQPDCLAVNPMVDKSPSSPSLSPTHNIQAAMLHS